MFALLNQAHRKPQHNYLIHWSTRREIEEGFTKFYKKMFWMLFYLNHFLCFFKTKNSRWSHLRTTIIPNYSSLCRLYVRWMNFRFFLIMQWNIWCSSTNEWISLNISRRCWNVFENYSSSPRPNKNPPTSSSVTLQTFGRIQRSVEYRQERIFLCPLQRQRSTNGANLSLRRNTVHSIWDLQKGKLKRFDTCQWRYNISITVLQSVPRSNAFH